VLPVGEVHKTHSGQEPCGIGHIARAGGPFQPLSRLFLSPSSPGPDGPPYRLPDVPGSVRAVVAPPPDPPETGSSPTLAASWQGAETPLRVLVVLLLVEAAALAALGIGFLVALAVAHRQTQAWVALSEAGLCLLVGAMLALMARGLLGGRRWPRSPAITLQLVGLPISGRLVEFGGWGLALPMIAVLVVSLVLLFGTAPRPGSGSGSEQPTEPDSR
jgi:hypothetical protein